MRKTVLLGVVALAIVATACTIDTGAQRSSSSPAVGQAFGNTQTLPPTDEPVATVASEALPAVVNVTSDIVSSSGQAGQGVGTGIHRALRRRRRDQLSRRGGRDEDHRLHLRGQAEAVRRPRDRRRLRARPRGPEDRRQELPTLALGNSAGPGARPKVVAIGYALALEGGP